MLTNYTRIGETARWETLPNGLPVCIVPKKDFQRKYALFATRYGGMDMKFQLDGQWLDTPAGIAHYLEHKMFDTAEGNALQELAKNGAEKKEQGIIGQEIGMIEDNPEWQCYKQLMQGLYHHSPARTPIAGSVESIRQITAQTLYDCHKAFYTPANMCLVVVGDVDGDEVLRLAEEVLPKTSGPLIPRDYGVEEPLTPCQKETRGRMEIAMPTFMAGFKCPPQRGGEEQARSTALGELAIDVLAGESSPLYARLYSQGLLNGSFGCSYDILPGVAYVYLGGDSNDPNAVVKAVLDEAQRLVKEGIDPAYYLRLRNANFGTALKALNSFEGIAVSMAEGKFHDYDPYRFPEIYDSISADDVLDFIRENLVEERCAVSIIEPLGEAKE